MLQGSLENFALDEVLGLLSGTSKTGQLEIAGNRGTGSLVFDEGRLVDGSASYTANGVGVEDVMFELLRYDDGTFTFTNREVTSTTNPENVASVLASAENRLRDWRTIESVVPTLSHQVVPCAELPADEVTISRAEWAALTVIAAGCPVSLVCDKLHLGEVEGSRQIKNLAERDLVIVSPPIGGFTSAYRAASSSAAELAAEETPLGGLGSDFMTEPVEPIEAAAPIEPVEEPETVEAFAADPFSPADPFDAADPIGSESYDAPESEPVAPVSAALEALVGERPPMPPAPGADELSSDLGIGSPLPPAPPSPAEISSFGEGLEDASELVETAEETKGGGLLSRYLKSDD